MPTLPNLDVSQAHYDRIVAAFPGSSLADKAANYKNWLTNSLIAEVERLERQKIMSAQAEQLAAQLQALQASLPKRADYPVGSQPAPVSPVSG